MDTYGEPIVVRLKYAMKGYPVGAELGFDTLAEAVQTFYTANAFDVVRTQDGDDLDPPTPEEIAEAEAAALARERASRIVRGSEFDVFAADFATAGDALEAQVDAKVDTAAQAAIAAEPTVVQAAADAAAAAVDANPTIADHETRIANREAAGTGPAPRVSDIGRYVLDGPGAITTWDTYDASGVVVHPSVLHVPRGWNGARWWAAATPYNGGSIALENPCIFQSVDGVTWTEPAGVTNPLVAKPSLAYNSDTHLTLGPDNHLYLFYRSASEAGQPDEENLYVISSADGVTWTAPTLLMTSATPDWLLSPAVWYDASAGEWVMLTVRGWTNIVRRSTAPDATGPWSAPVNVTMTPAWPSGATPWHIDAQDVGGQIVATVMCTGVGGSAAGGPVYLMVSDDEGQTFRRATQPLTAIPSYRSCIVPVVTESGLTFDAWIGQPGPDWGVHRRRILPAILYRDEMVLAFGRAQYPYVLLDQFDRSDATTLGTAPTGQAWTTPAGSGAFGITSGKAHALATGNNRAIIDTGMSEYEFSCTLDTSTLNIEWYDVYLYVAYVSGSNYIRVGQPKGLPVSPLTVERFVPGVGIETLATADDPLPLASDVRVSIRHMDGIVAVFVDGVEAVSVEVPISGSQVGMTAPLTSLTFDDITVRAL